VQKARPQESLTGRTTPLLTLRATEAEPAVIGTWAPDAAGR